MSAGRRLDHLRGARLDVASGGKRLTGVTPRGIIPDDPTAEELADEFPDGPVEVEIHPGSVEIFADPDEPLFVLRARDRSAPGVVVDWIRANIETAPEHKLREALDQALRMRAYPYRRNAD